MAARGINRNLINTFESRIRPSGYAESRMVAKLMALNWRRYKRKIKTLRHGGMELVLRNINHVRCVDTTEGTPRPSLSAVSGKILYTAPIGTNENWNDEMSSDAETATSDDADTEMELEAEEAACQERDSQGDPREIRGGQLRAGGG